jgi:hypothetical protein
VVVACIYKYIYAGYGKVQLILWFLQKILKIYPSE